MQFLLDGILHRVITAVQMSLEGSAGLGTCVRAAFTASPSLPGPRALSLPRSTSTLRAFMFSLLEAILRNDL